MVTQQLQGVARYRQRDPEGGGQVGHHQVGGLLRPGRGRAHQRHEHHPIPAAILSGRCGLDRQPGLADPARPDQGHQPAGGVVEQLLQPGQLPIAAHEPGQPHRQVGRPGAEGAQCREAVGQASDEQLPQPLGMGQVLEAMLTQLPQPHPRRQLGPQQLPGRLRAQDLPPVPSRADPRRPMHHQPGITVAIGDRLAGVHAHAHPQPHPVGPAMGGQRPLALSRRRHRVAGPREGNEERVTLGADLTPAELGEGGPKQPPMLPQHLQVAVAQPLQQPGRALDVGEQQRDRAARQLGHDAPSPASQPRRLDAQTQPSFPQVRTPDNPGNEPASTPYTSPSARWNGRGRRAVSKQRSFQLSMMPKTEPLTADQVKHPPGTQTATGDIAVRVANASTRRPTAPASPDFRLS